MIMKYTDKQIEKFKEMFRNGILEQLENAGVQEGDTIRMYGLQFEYYR